MDDTKLKPKIVITGGGTGGHIMPAIAVADVLAKHQAAVIFIGSHSSQERELVKKAGYPFYSIQTGKWRRYLALANIVDFFKVIIGFWQARNLLAKLKPNAVFSKGGFVSLPVVYAAAFLEISIVAHESDAVMGLANCLARNKAKLICTGFPIGNYEPELRGRLRYTGNPIRNIFFKKNVAARTIIKKLGMRLGKPIVLFMGSSQGAQAINELVFTMLPYALTKFQIIHLTGQQGIAKARNVKSGLSIDLKSCYVPFDFLGKELVDLMSVSDLVISRASASALAELAYLGKPSILIPLPTAASDHQRANAKIFRRKQAAIVLEQNNLTVNKLLQVICDLLGSKSERQRLARSIRLFASPQSASLIAEAVLTVARQADIT